MTTTALPEFALEDVQLAIPGMDGYRADKIAIGFSGGVDLDRTSSEDLEFVNGLKMFQEVQLLVTATVVKKSFAGSKGLEGETQVGYGVGLKIHSLDVA